MPKNRPLEGIQQPRAISNMEVRAVEGNSNQLELSFSSEFAVSRWYGNEILLHEESAVDMNRLTNVGTVLFAHGRDVRHGKMPVARIDSAWVDAPQKKCRALITFDEDEESQKVKTKVLSGSIKGVSFGYSVSSWEEVAAGKMSANGRFMGPAYVALKWEPYEISIEPTPADPSVGVGRGFEENENQEEESMRRNFRGPMLAPDNGAGGGEPPNVSAEREAAIQAERQRVSGIDELCREFGVESGPYIKDGSTLEQVRTAVLEKLKAERQPSRMSTGEVRVITEEADKFRAAASDSIILRAGRSIAKPADGATDLRGMKLRDLAIDCLSRAGRSNAHRMDDDQLFREALTPDGQFGSILSDSVNKSMATAYRGAQTTYQAWTGRGSNSDFKAATHYQISEAGELQKMTQSGEFKFDEMKDQGVSKALATFGRTFGLTRQALINDDIGALTKIPEAYVRAAGRGINKLVYKMIGSNPAIYDGTALFHASHGNLGTAGKIATPTLSELRMLTRKQKNLRGKEILNISPTFLLVPAALETDAEKILISPADPSGEHSGVANVFKSSLTLVVDAELDEYSSTAYYTAAAPGDIDTIEVTYLNGDDMPKLESQVGFDFLGIRWRIYIDYGVTVLDYRGLSKNAGV